MIAQYSLTVSADGDGLAVELSPAGKIKACNSVSHVERLHFGTGALGTARDMLFCGFQSTDFVLWNVTQYYQICRLPCGGGRRPYAVSMHPTDPSQRFSIAWSAGGKLFAHMGGGAGGGSVSARASLMTSHHGREINDVVMLNLCKDPSVSANAMVVTGGEDTFIKLLSHGKRDGQPYGGTIAPHTLAGHPSAVRALALSHIAGRWPVLISVGAKQALLAWMIATNSSDETGATGVASTLLCRREARRKRGDSGTIEHRYMSTAVFPVVSTADSVLHLVVAGCSSSDVDVFLLDELQRSWEPRATLCGNAGAVLCVEIVLFPATDDAPPICLVVAGGTGGQLAVWDMSSVVSLVGGAAAGGKLQPVASVASHQSGVNCLTVMAGDGPMSRLLATGGDDNALAARTMSVLRGDSGLVEVSFGSEWRDDSAHAAAVKGLGANSSRLYSTGADSRLNCWAVNAGTAECTLESSEPLTVSNVASLAVADEGVVVVGHGLEALM